MRTIVLFALLVLSSCSIPNLEDPQCTAARNPVREFYSYHFGNDMKPSPENLELRKKFLSKELYAELSAAPGGDVDYFTGTSDLPKAFRIGTCKPESPDKTMFQVLLFWKDDTRSKQEEIHVEAVKQDDTWLVNKVTK